MSRIIGCKNLHIAEVTKDDSTSTTWGPLKPVKSLISISISDQKENVTFYSDDTVEQVLPSFTSKEVSIELGYLTPEIEALISGNKYENGVFTQSANATSKEFAILFEASLSKGGTRRVCLYKGVLAKNDSEYQGKQDSIESSNVTLTGVFMPLQSNGLVEIKADTNDSTLSGAEQTMVNNWFTKVPELQPGLRTAKEK
nr:MAG TPA: major tail protein [Caudoviricetes sp.]